MWGKHLKPLVLMFLNTPLASRLLLTRRAGSVKTIRFTRFAQTGGIRPASDWVLIVLGIWLWFDHDLLVFDVPSCVPHPPLPPPILPTLRPSPLPLLRHPRLPFAPLLPLLPSSLLFNVLPPTPRPSETSSSSEHPEPSSRGNVMEW